MTKFGKINKYFNNLNYDSIPCLQKPHKSIHRKRGFTVKNLSTHDTLTKVSDSYILYTLV